MMCSGMNGLVGVLGCDLRVGIWGSGFDCTPCDDLPNCVDLRFLASVCGVPGKALRMRGVRGVSMTTSVASLAV